MKLFIWDYMPRIDYVAMLKPFAREMRKNMTPQEKHLWYDYLRNCVAQVRRQKQFGRFIVDFYCASAKLVIEVDGSQHYSREGLAYDRERTAYLKGLGLSVIRFTNDDIDNRFESVCKAIEQAISQT